MVEMKWILLVRLEATSLLANELSVSHIGQGQHFLLERCSPSYPVLFLFLNVLDRHVCGVVRSQACIGKVNGGLDRAPSGYRALPKKPSYT